MIEARGKSGRVLRALVAMISGSTLVLAASLILIRHCVEAEAEQRAAEILGGMAKDTLSDDSLAKAATAHVYKALIGGAGSASPPILVRLRPYLASSFIPRPARVRTGAIDLVYLDMFCDNAARALGFVLEEAGFETGQLNIVTPGNAHTVLLARNTQGREFLLDPYAGVVPESNGRLLGPENARTLARQGVPAEEIWNQLEPGQEFPDFYREFAEAVYARQGEPLEITAVVTLPEGKLLQLGTADKSPADVIADGNLARLTPHWHYMGNRYDGSWTRILRFSQPTRIIFGLTGIPDTHMVTSTTPPSILGNNLVYEVAAGDALIFRDGSARYDWLTFRSYQDVDYVRFEPLD